MARKPARPRLTVTAWRCLGCDDTWTGTAIDTLKPYVRTETGDQINAHVLATGHTVTIAETATAPDP